MSRPILLLMLTLVQGYISAQTLEELLEAKLPTASEYAYSTFKSTRIVNGHSIQRMPEKQLDFRISHRFSELNGGIYEFFGLDYAQIHLSLEYGINDWLMVGLGRSNFEKTADGFAKFSVLRQSSGERNMPVHLSFLLAAEVFGMKWMDGADRTFGSRMTYVQQILVARKFNDAFSLQLTPTHIFRNLPPYAEEPHSLFALGIGGMYKVTNRMSVNCEYYPVFRDRTEFSGIKYHNPFSIGVDIETGGHVFQLMLTNSRSMREGSFIGRTTGNWFDGDIHFGFNISRIFSFN